LQSVSQLPGVFLQKNHSTMAKIRFFSGHICQNRVALVVACDFERSIESSSGTVVQQSIAHQVQDVLDVVGRVAKSAAIP